MIIASGAGAAVLTVMFGDIRFFTPTFLIVAGVAVFLGLPIYLAARAARNDTPVTASVMGFIVGAAIPAILILPMPAADYASVGGTVTSINGAYTPAGWLQNFAIIGFCGALGIGSALLFWFIVRRGVSSKDGEPAPARTSRTALLSLAAAAVVAAAFAIPYATADRSCHNPLRDGRTSIQQVASFDLRVGLGEWRNVADEVERFGRSGDWSVRSDVRIDADFPWFQISLCKETGTNILVQGLEDFGQVSFGVYQPQGGPTWRADFRALYQRISARWPDRIGFTDGQGRPAKAPEWATEQRR